MIMRKVLCRFQSTVWSVNELKYANLATGPKVENSSSPLGLSNLT